MFKIISVCVVSLVVTACGQAPSSSQDVPSDNTDHATQVVFKMALQEIIKQEEKVQAGTATDKEYLNSIGAGSSLGASAAFKDVPSLEVYQEFRQAKQLEQFTGSFKEWAK